MNPWIHFCGEPLLPRREGARLLLPLLLMLFLLHCLPMAQSRHFSGGLVPSPAPALPVLPLAEIWPDDPGATNPCHHLTGGLPSLECAHPHGMALPGALFLDLETGTGLPFSLTAPIREPHNPNFPRQSRTGPPPFPPPEDPSPLIFDPFLQSAA